MRFSFVTPLVLFGGIQAAQASFDLMYIPSPSTNRVIRYDPVNRIQLGSFSAPGASAVYGGGAQMAAVAINAGLYRYNLNTNANMGFLTTTSAQSYDPATNTALSVAGSNYFQRNIDINSLLSVTLVGSSGLLRANNILPGTIGAYQVSGGVLSFRTHNQTSGAFIGQSAFADPVAFTRVSNMISITNRTGARVAVMAGFDAATGWRLYRTIIAGSSITISAANISGFSTAHSVALAPSHAGYYVVGTDSVGPPALTRFAALDDDGAGIQYDSWTEGFVSGSTSPNYSVGMVVAPEPGTMAALGLGLVALLRRRRASTSR